MKVKKKNIKVCVKENKGVYVRVWEKNFEDRRRVLRALFKVFF
jgi:ribosomal protein S17E